MTNDVIRNARLMRGEATPTAAPEQGGCVPEDALSGVLRHTTRHGGAKDVAATGPGARRQAEEAGPDLGTAQVLDLGETQLAEQVVQLVGVPPDLHRLPELGDLRGQRGAVG